ncbi:porin family protein [Xanthomarina sp. GH4-25]|uniref:porin family protein n=1 Tax=Xanthomarina sp. GH4-25 TaxID=3349335 RepID=UPI003877BE51
MKKVLLMAAVAVFGFSNMNAQNVSFGVKAGMNISTVAGDFGNYYDYWDGDQTRDSKSKVGFHVGGLAEIMISEKFAVQPELLFSSQGYKTSFYDIDDNKKDNNVNLSYITLPVMAKFFPIENLSIEAGPQVGFLISAKDDESDYYNDMFPDEEEIKTKDAFKGTDFAMNIGAGYKLDNGVFFQARYSFGLSKVDDEDYYNDPDYGDVYNNFAFSRKNRVFQLSVGYMF